MKGKLSDLHHNTLVTQDLTTVCMKVYSDDLKRLIKEGLVEKSFDEMDDPIFPENMIMFDTSGRCYQDAFKSDATMYVIDPENPIFETKFQKSRGKYIAVYLALFSWSRHCSTPHPSPYPGKSRGKGDFKYLEEEARSTACDKVVAPLAATAAIGSVSVLKYQVPTDNGYIMMDKDAVDRIVKLGTEQKPPTAEDIADVQEQLAKVPAYPNLTFVTGAHFTDVLGPVPDHEKTTWRDRTLIRSRQANIQPCIKNMETMLNSITWLEQKGFPDDVSMDAFLKIKPHIKAFLKSVEKIKQEKS